MQKLVRPLLLVALVAASAGVVVQPALACAHALEHLEEARAADPPGEAPGGDAEDEAHCDLCLSLSQGRAALDSTAAFGFGQSPLVGLVEPLAPQPVSIRPSRAPESPRAPPLT